MFVTFEGIDGSGKTTQAALLADELRAGGMDVVETREPGGTPLGEAIRDLVLHGGHVTPWAEAALYTASRAQHVEEIVRPALERGTVVVCDRYLDSSVAYQGAGRGLGVDAVLELNLTAVRGLLPDRTVLVDLDPLLAFERLGTTRDRIERDGIELQARAAAAYHELARRYAERYVVVDGSLAPAEIAMRVRAAILTS